MPQDFAAYYFAVPLGIIRGRVLIAFGEPTTPIAISDLAEMLATPIIAVKGDRDEIERAIARLYPVPPSTHLSSALA